MGIFRIARRWGEALDYSSHRQSSAEIRAAAIKRDAPYVAANKARRERKVQAKWDAAFRAHGLPIPTMAEVDPQRGAWLAQRAEHTAVWDARLRAM